MRRVSWARGLAPKATRPVSPCRGHLTRWGKRWLSVEVRWVGQGTAPSGAKQHVAGGRVTGDQTPGRAQTTKSKAVWFIGGGGRGATCHSPQEWRP